MPITTIIPFSQTLRIGAPKTKQRFTVEDALVKTFSLQAQVHLLASQLESACLWQTGKLQVHTPINSNTVPRDVCLARSHVTCSLTRHSQGTARTRFDCGLEMFFFFYIRNNFNTGQFFSVFIHPYKGDIKVPT